MLRAPLEDILESFGELTRLPPVSPAYHTHPRGYPPGLRIIWPRIRIRWLISARIFAVCRPIRKVADPHPRRGSAFYPIRADPYARDVFVMMIMTHSAIFTM